MKYYIPIILILAVLNCQGQDTAKNVSKHSISFTAGANIVHPIAISIPGGPWGGTPFIGAGFYSALSYNYTLLYTKHSVLGIKFGVGYTQYSYYAGYGEAEVGSPILIQQINEGEFWGSMFANIALFKKIGWYNEFDIYGSCAMSITPQGSGDNIQLANLPYGNDFNVFLMYQTGITFFMNKNFSLTPIFSIPLVNFTAVANQAQANSDYNHIIAYQSFRTGIMVTYNFNKK